MNNKPLQSERVRGAFWTADEHDLQRLTIEQLKALLEPIDEGKKGAPYPLMGGHHTDAEWEELKAERRRTITEAIARKEQQSDPD